MTSNSIIEALAKPAGSRDDLARDLAAYCREQAEGQIEVALGIISKDGFYMRGDGMQKPEALTYYLEALEWEAKAARILQSVVFQRETSLSAEQRAEVIRMIANPQPYWKDGEVGFKEFVQNASFGAVLRDSFGTVSPDINLDFDGGEA